MVLSGSHANRKMNRTVWCSAKRKLFGLLVSLSKIVRPTGGLTKENCLVCLSGCWIQSDVLVR